MIGRRLFRSRWAALLWAGGIVWTACDVAEATKSDDAASTPTANGSAALDATGMIADAKDLAVLAGAGNTN